jgi:hypothetical protein
MSSDELSLTIKLNRFLKNGVQLVVMYVDGGYEAYIIDIADNTSAYKPGTGASVIEALINLEKDLPYV